MAIVSGVQNMIEILPSEFALLGRLVGRVGSRPDQRRSGIRASAGGMEIVLCPTLPYVPFLSLGPPILWGLGRRGMKGDEGDVRGDCCLVPT